MKFLEFCPFLGNSWFSSEFLFSVILTVLFAFFISILCTIRKKRKFGLLPLWIVVAIVNSIGAMVFWYWYMFPDPTFPELVELESNLVNTIYLWSAIVVSFASIGIWLLILRYWLLKDDDKNR